MPYRQVGDAIAECVRALTAADLERVAMSVRVMALMSHPQRDEPPAVFFRCR